jgi:acyl transferase domain-containing protein
MERLNKNSIEHHIFSGPERDRAESICELVVFAEANAAELLKSIYFVLNNKTLNHVDGLKWISYHSQDAYRNARASKQYRVAVIAYGMHELKRQLKQVVKMIEENPRTAFSYSSAGLYYGFGAPEGKLAFLFPGQGAQYVRMGEALAGIYPKAQAVWDQMGTMAFKGKTVNNVVFPPEPRNKEEAYTQAAELSRCERSLPAITVMSESILVLLEAMALKPDAVAAHSLGDLSSYRAAGVLTPEQMIRIAASRGVIASSCPMATSGDLFVVYADPETTRAVLNKHAVEHVWIVNYNSPSLNVLACWRDSLEKAKAAFGKESINSKIIPLNAAPHSPLGLRGSNIIIKYLANESFQKANCDVYSYLFGKKMKNDPALFRKVLGINLLKPMRFVDQIKNMYADGVRTFVEIGPSEGLSMLADRILGDKPYRFVSTNRRKGDANFHFLSSVAELIVLGRIKDTCVLWEDYRKPRKPGLSAATGNGATKSDLERFSLTNIEADRLKTLDLELSKINNIASIQPEAGKLGREQNVGQV